MQNKLKSPKKHIVVGLSGGVDSAVTALTLTQQGHHVQAVFMNNWQAQPDDPYCTAQQDLSDARAVCDTIGIPLSVVNFSQNYWDRVFQKCLDDFAAGFTPNPDILCNREIKFSCFLEHALKLGADVIATGHYAQVRSNTGTRQLLRGFDHSKDQSYFLHALGQRALSHALFPLGTINKKEVRQLAQKAGLPNAGKADSTGICFIGERRFKPFLQQYLLAQPGSIQTETGQELGRHDGLMFYTLGQRKGLHIGGSKDHPELPWYVIDKNLNDNILIVGQGHNHVRLLNEELITGPVHWISEQPPSGTQLSCQAQIRYRQRAQECTLYPLDNDLFRVQFQQAQWAITPGQSVVFYDGDICLGGGIIHAKPCHPQPGAPVNQAPALNPRLVTPAPTAGSVNQAPNPRLVTPAPTAGSVNQAPALNPRLVTPAPTAGSVNQAPALNPRLVTPDPIGGPVN